MKALINSFNTGEVSPLLVGRVDLDSMRRACRKMKNFIPRVFGGAFRRPPLLHVAVAKVADQHVRLIPFAFSATTKYQIEAGHLYLRMFNGGTGAVVFGGDEEPCAAPWTAAEVDDVQFVQVNDVMFLAHPNHPPHELLRKADNDWTLRALPWGTEVGAYPPMSDENLLGTTLRCDAATGAAVLYASAPLFQQGHVGSFWQIGHFREELSAELEFTPPARQSKTSQALPMATGQLGWELVTSGNWSGTILVEKENTTDHEWDIEDQFENRLGDQVSAKGTGLFESGSTPTTDKFRIRANQISIQDGAPTKLSLFRIDPAGNHMLEVKLEFAPPTALSGTSTELRVNGGWEFSTYGRWSGKVFVEQKNAAGTWDVIRRWTGEMDRNLTASGTVEGEQTLRVRAAGITAAAASDVQGPRFVLEASQARVYGLVKVTSVSTSTQATVTVIRALWSTAETTNWSEGAWSAAKGYPRAVALHEQRLVFAGTLKEPQTIWGSVSADFRNFEQTGLDDGSFVYQIAAQESNPIAWLASQDGLIIGTEGDEWLLDGEGKAITPSNVRTKRQSRYGSARIQATMAGSTVLFVQRGGLALREYLFEWEQQNYVAPQVTQLAQHLTLAGIRAYAYSQNPEQLLWVVTQDGRLLSCTYRREEKVIAWSEHPTDGLVESVSAVYGEAASGDEVWLVVRRNGTRRIERLDAGHWRRLEGGGLLYHLDAATVKIQDSEFTSVGGLEHLEGRVVGIVANGAELPLARVAGGVVAVPEKTRHAVVGLLSTAVLQPMPFEVPLQDGTAQGRRFIVKEIVLQMYRSQAGSYADGEDGAVYPLSFRAVEDDPDAPPPAFTGMKTLTMMARHRDAVDTVISTDSPMSLNVLSLIPSLEVYGN